MMAKWRALFEANPSPPEHDSLGVEYIFGPPATTEQIEAAEQALGVRLPDDVREMLFEFNGIWFTIEVTRAIDYEPDIAYLDTNFMSIDVPEYFQNCGNVLPPAEDLQKVVFVYQSNGFGDLYGVCVAEVAGHRIGEVVKLDHEVGKLERFCATLAEFVRTGPK